MAESVQVVGAWFVSIAGAVFEALVGALILHPIAETNPGAYGLGRTGESEPEPGTMGLYMEDHRGGGL